MGWTLRRYFFFRYISITFWMTLFLFAVAFLVSSAELASRLSNLAGSSVWVSFGIAAMRTPLVLLQAIPFVALFSAMATLIALNRRYELVVTRSAGVSAWQFLMPLCVGAMLVGLIAVFAISPIAAALYSQSEIAEADLRSGQSNKVSAFKAPWLRQEIGDGDMIIGAHAILRQGLELADASFFEFDANGNLVDRTDAVRAYLHDGYWELRSAKRYGTGTRATEIATTRIPTTLKPEFVQERLARPETVPIYELPEKIRMARSFGLRAESFGMQLHSLIAMPALLVAMTLIAATVSMRFARLGQSGIIIVGGVGAGFLLYVVSVLVKAFGNAGIMPPVVAAWAPVMVAMFFGVTYLLYREDG